MKIEIHAGLSEADEQTPPIDQSPDAETTRIDVYLNQVIRVVSDYYISQLRYVITDGYDSKPKFLAGVHALGLEQIGKRRLDANLRYLYQGPKRPGPGRPTTYDGKVTWDYLQRFDQVETADDAIVLYHQVLNHVQFQCALRVVLVVATTHNRRAVLFSTDRHLEALSIRAFNIVIAGRAAKTSTHDGYFCLQRLSAVSV